MNGIRRAEERDIPAVARLLLQVQAVHAEGRPDLFNKGARKYGDAELAVIFADDSRPVFLLETDVGVVGYAFCILEETPASASLKPQKTLYIDDLCVDEAQRGKHIGTLLYDYVIAYAKEQACDRITLNVWELNAGAKEFYRKRGLLPLKTTMEQRLK